MCSEGEIIQLTSPHVSSPHRLSVQYWLLNVCISMCKTRRESNMTPRMVQPLALHGQGSSCPGTLTRSPSHPAETRGAPSQHVPSGSFVTGSHAPCKAWPARPRQRDSQPLIPGGSGCSKPPHQFWVNNPAPRRQRRAARGCPVLWHSFRAEHRAQLFCSSPGIINRSGSDRVFSKH